MSLFLSFLISGSMFSLITKPGLKVSFEVDKMDPIDILALFKPAAGAETPGGSDDGCWAYDEFTSSSSGSKIQAKLMNIPLISGGNDAPFSSETKQLLLTSGSMDLLSCEARGSMSYPGSVLTAKFSLGGSFIAAVGGGDFGIRLYDSKTLKLKATLLGHTSAVYSLAFFKSNGREMLASGSNDTTLKLWDVASCSCAETLEGTGPIHAVCFHQESATLFAASTGAKVLCYHVSNSPAQLVETIAWAESSFAVALNPDGSSLAIGSDCNRVTLRNSTTRTELKSHYDDVSQPQHQVCMNGLCFSKDGTMLFYTTSDGLVRTWNLSNDMRSAAAFRSFGGNRCPILFSPDDKYIISASSSKIASVYNAQTQKRLQPFPAAPSQLTSFDFSPDGSTFMYTCLAAETPNVHLFSSKSQVQMAVDCPAWAVDMRIIKSSADVPIACIRGANHKLAFRILNDKFCENAAGPTTVSSSSSSPVAVAAGPCDWHDIVYVTSDDEDGPRPCPTLYTLIPGKLFKIADNQPKGIHHTFEPIYVGKYGQLFSEETQALRERSELMNSRELAFKEKELALDLFHERFESYSIKVEECVDSILTDMSFAKLSSDSSDKKEALAAHNLLSKFELSLRKNLGSSMSELRTLYVRKDSGSLQEQQTGCAINWKSIRVGKEIGSNGFGSVYLCKFKVEGNPFVTISVPARPVQSALELNDSRMNPAESHAPAELEATIRKALEAEVAVLKRLTHTNIIRYFGCTVSPSAWRPICIVQQFCASGDLHSFLESHHPLNIEDGSTKFSAASASNSASAASQPAHKWTEQTAFQAALQIAGALAYLHKEGIVHRDLKPANILMIQFPEDVLDMTVYKVADLGQANLKHLNDELTKAASPSSDQPQQASAAAGAASGSAARARKRSNPNPVGLAADQPISRFCPPELFDRNGIQKWSNSMAQDLWAYGLVLYQMRTGLQPFDDGMDSNATVFASIIKGEAPGDWPEEDAEFEQVQEAELNTRPWSWLRSLAELCLQFSPEKRLANFKGVDSFEVIEKRLCEMRPEWAKQVHCSMLKFQRMEIRDPYLAMQYIPLQ